MRHGADRLTQIVLFRVLQGAFGAALVPLSQSVLFIVYPKERQGFAMALFGVGVMVGPVLGPVLGGWLTENYSWRYVFYINLPIGILGLIGICSFLPDTPRRQGDKLDWFGFGTLSLALSARCRSCSTAARSKTGSVPAKSSSRPWSQPRRSICLSFTPLPPKSRSCGRICSATAISPPASFSSLSSA